MQEEVSRIFSRNVRRRLEMLDSDTIQEIRLRVGQPLMILKAGGQETFIANDGRQENCPGASSYRVTRQDVKETLEYVASYSLYAYEEELRQGYITIQGGHRVGVAGRTVCDGSGIRSMKFISFLNLRLAHQLRGCADPVLPQLCSRSRRELYHTLIFSPPRGGKTTLLRDLIRQVSDGDSAAGRPGMTVGVVDERSELAACYQGVPQNDMGIRTDVLDGCPKARGMMMLIRTMAPQIVAVDEIGSTGEVEALEYAMNCGCRILATVHGNSLDEIRRKPVLRRMVQEQWFERYVQLESGYRITVYDGMGRKLWAQE